MWRVNSAAPMHVARQACHAGFSAGEAAAWLVVGPAFDAPGGTARQGLTRQAGRRGRDLTPSAAHSFSSLPSSSSRPARLLLPPAAAAAPIPPQIRRFGLGKEGKTFSTSW